MLLFFCGTRFPERAQPFRWTYRSHENGNVVTMAHRWQALPFMGFIQQQRRNTPDKRARCGADKKAGKRLPLVAQSRGVAKATQRQQVRINALFHFVDNLSFGIFCCSWISSFLRLRGISSKHSSQGKRMSMLVVMRQNESNLFDKVSRTLD